MLQKGPAHLSRDPGTYQEVYRSWPVRIHGEQAPGAMQRETKSGGGFWPAWVHARFDAHTLAGAAVELFCGLCPKVCVCQC